MNFKNSKTWDEFWASSEPWQKEAYLSVASARKVIQEITLRALPDQPDPKNCYLPPDHEKVLIVQKNFVFEALLELFTDQILSKEKQNLQMALLSFCAECFSFGQNDYIKQILKFIANSEYDFQTAHKNRMININAVRELVRNMFESIKHAIDKYHYETPRRFWGVMQETLFELHNLAAAALVKMADWQQIIETRECSAIPYLAKFVLSNNGMVKTISDLCCNSKHKSHAVSALLQLLVARNAVIRQIIKELNTKGESDAVDQEHIYDEAKIAYALMPLAIDFPERLIDLNAFKNSHDGKPLDDIAINEAFDRFDKDVETRKKCIVECLDNVLKETAMLLGLSDK
ncbi:MAG: hypothetical protein M1338_03935 [Patescibacteria group bacterium]|nr:hypothetical protein [Patescibacteria group bacterium]